MIVAGHVRCAEVHLIGAVLRATEMVDTLFPFFRPGASVPVVVGVQVNSCCAVMRLALMAVVVVALPCFLELRGRRDAKLGASVPVVVGIQESVAVSVLRSSGGFNGL